MDPVANAPEALHLTGHCLLRLCTSLALEAGGIDHGHPPAVEELNQRTGRRHGAATWLKILEPAYRQRFDPSSGD